MTDPDARPDDWQQQIDADAQAALAEMKTIAVVGLSPRPERDSHEVAAYMQQQGYRIVPVNPAAAGAQILGETVHATLDEAQAALSAEGVAIDTVDVFRRSVDTDAPIADAIAAGARCVWLQLGIVNADGLRRAREAGLLAVEDRCLLIEHQRLATTDSVR